MNGSLISAVAGRLLRFGAKLKPKFRLILDKERQLGNFSAEVTGFRADLNKEEVSRHHVLSRPGESMTFLDVGARDGELTYLLGIRGKLEFEQAFYDVNLANFHAKYSYYGMDLAPASASDSRVISGDACDPAYVEKNASFSEFFDVIYSNNVFEHFARPWIAAANLTRLLRPGGIIITVVPFSQRYHESPGDYFRYTHKGVEELFASAGDFDILESGYDIQGRRINWQGSGKAHDIVPVDAFGAWRETWFTVSILRKR
jgi:SAM-dependent methyltransferase